MNYHFNYRVMKTKFTNQRIVRLGTKVLYRGGFGSHPQKVAIVTGIERTKFPREKYGDEVESVRLDEQFVLNLNNGTWCYSDQVDGVVPNP